MPEIIVKPSNLKELWKMLPGLPARRRYLAGGTDLVTAGVAGVEHSECWIDIGDLPELGSIKEAAGSLFIGSGVKISEIESSKAAARWCPALVAAIPHFASPSLRNMATLGGNAANASPCADGACSLVAEGASVLLALKGKKRRLPLVDFFLGPKLTALKKDELILGFEIRKRRHAGAYLKLGPRAYFGISKAAVAVTAELSGGAVKRVRVALGSVAPVPLYAARTSAFLADKKLSAETIAEASALVRTEASPITDTRSEAAYRLDMCGVLLERALKSLA
ncbi:MAG: xanthine dehydrogenase family protein subunit M [Elusimicrobia bacterium]|nr:xanthine dehydrogenase family protein subunit M [Elusimicrobiota bacterium]